MFPTRLYRFYYMIVRVYMRIFYSFRVVNRAAIPQGKCLVCCNHTSLVDALAVASALRNKNGIQMAKYVGKIELSRVPVLRKLIRSVMIFVDRGNADIGAVKKVISHLKDDGKVVIFPEGQRVDEGVDVGAKTGVIMMAIKADAPLLPVYITSKKKPPLFFGKVDVIIGEPYTVERGDRSVPTGEVYRMAADDLLERIFALKAQAR